jgi:DNA-binding NarL/FixJ family response regulator
MYPWRGKLIRILIADDHPLIREGLKQIISDEKDMEVRGEASNVEEMMQLLGKCRYDIVILDITMPGRSGLDALEDLRRKYPELPVLILSIHPENEYAIRAFRSGAKGYITKQSMPQELVNAIRKIVDGKKYISSSIAEKIIDILGRGDDREPHECLSKREFQVMQKLASGKTVRQIAADLFISENTVRTYKTRILEKMRMNNIVELIRYAIENNLVE